MPMTAKRVIVAVSVLLLGACDMLGITRVCTTEARPAIAVRMLDATTGSLPAADSGRISVRDGDFIESVTVPRHVFEQEILIGLATERPGMYSVEVDVSGYELWTTEGVRVDMTDDRCHVDTRIITADLEPTSS